MSFLARFKNDPQLGEDWIRPSKRSSYPQSVNLLIQPREGSGKDDVKLSDKWLKYVRPINPDNGKYVLTPPAGWLNSNIAADSLGFGGNAIWLDEGNRDFYRVVSLFNFRDEPPDPKICNYQNGDPRIQKFTVITKDGKIRNAGAGLDAYTIIIGRGALFVAKERVELFPKLPMEVVVTEPLGLKVRQGPGIEFVPIVELAKGTTTTITEYELRGSSVWGRIANHYQWIALEWWPDPSYRDPLFFTSWRMETRPPIPPRLITGAPGDGPAQMWPKTVVVIKAFTKLYHLPGRAMNGMALFGQQLSASEAISFQKEDYFRTGGGFVLMKDVKEMGRENPANGRDDLAPTV